MKTLKMCLCFFVVLFSVGSLAYAGGAIMPDKVIGCAGDHTSLTLTFRSKPPLIKAFARLENGNQVPLPVLGLHPLAQRHLHEQFLLNSVNCVARTITAQGVVCKVASAAEIYDTEGYAITLDQLAFLLASRSMFKLKTYVAIESTSDSLGIVANKITMVFKTERLEAVDLAGSSVTADGFSYWVYDNYTVIEDTNGSRITLSQLASIFVSNNAGGKATYAKIHVVASGYSMFVTKITLENSENSIFQTVVVVGLIDGMVGLTVDAVTSWEDKDGDGLLDEGEALDSIAYEIPVTITPSPLADQVRQLKIAIDDLITKNDALTKNLADFKVQVAREQLLQNTNINSCGLKIDGVKTDLANYKVQVGREQTTQNTKLYLHDSQIASILTSINGIKTEIQRIWDYILKNKK